MPNFSFASRLDVLGAGRVDDLDPDLAAAGITLYSASRSSICGTSGARSGWVFSLK